MGRLIVAESILDRTASLLREAGDRRPAHEGLVWWLGRHDGRDTMVLGCHRPACRSGPQSVIADEASVGRAARCARAVGLGVVAQVHSHPGADTRHSDGDDDLVLMPFDGMFSLVVADYGRGSLRPEEGGGLHQRQSEQWVLIRQDEPALIVVPAQVC